MEAVSPGNKDSVEGYAGDDPLEDKDMDDEDLALEHTKSEVLENQGDKDGIQFCFEDLPFSIVIGDRELGTTGTTLLLDFWTGAIGSPCMVCPADFDFSRGPYGRYHLKTCRGILTTLKLRIVSLYFLCPTMNRRSRTPNGFLASTA